MWRPPPSRLPPRAVRGRAPLALAHPPPVVLVCAGEGLAATGGGGNSIHLISKGAMVASGDRPSPTEAAAETESPFGTPRKNREKVRRNREEVKLPQSRLCRDSPLMEGACLPLWGRWPGGAGPEGVRAGRSRRGIFPSRTVTRPPLRETAEEFSCSARPCADTDEVEGGPIQGHDGLLPFVGPAGELVFRHQHVGDIE